MLLSLLLLDLLFSKFLGRFSCFTCRKIFWKWKFSDPSLIKVEMKAMKVLSEEFIKRLQQMLPIEIITLTDWI